MPCAIAMSLVYNAKMAKEIVTDGVDPLLRDGFNRPYVPVETSMPTVALKKEEPKKVDASKIPFPQPHKGPSLSLIEE